MFYLYTGTICTQYGRRRFYLCTILPWRLVAQCPVFTYMVGCRNAVWRFMSHITVVYKLKKDHDEALLVGFRPKYSPLVLFDLLLICWRTGKR